MAATLQTLEQPADAARAVGLRYALSAGPGLRRRRVEDRFEYVEPGGSVVRDAATLARIRALAIPPAWRDVWISIDPDAHLQATGRDARGRKQYRYHARWRALREETKFHRMIAFGEALPKIRARVAADLRKRGVPRDKVLATVVRFLETTLMRVGNEEYARANGHYGLTTLRNPHAKVAGSRVSFAFKGKSGKDHRVDVRDRRLATIVRHLQALPGQELFQYVNESGATRSVTSQDVNEYLRKIAGDEFSAKDFRTWAGTVIAAISLRIACEDGAPTKRGVAAAIRATAERLGNTPAICKKSYVHPALLAASESGWILPATDPDWAAEAQAGLSNAEKAVLALLKNKATEEQESLAGKLRRSLETEPSALRRAASSRGSPAPRARDPSSRRARPRRARGDRR